MRDYSGSIDRLRTDINFSRDFFQLSMSQQGLLHDEAKAAGYRKPKNANGSKARYFYALLQRRYINANN